MGETSLRDRLREVAELTGSGFEPPGVSVFAERRRRRYRTIGTVAAAVVTVAVVAVAATMIGGSPAAPPASLPRPHVVVAPGHVSASDLTGYHWDALPAAPIAARDASVAVWIGNQMIVWGGFAESDGHVFGDGASYDPATRTWQTLPPSPLSPRASAAFAWTGEQLFVWGGTSHPEDPTQGSADGAMYDPTTRTWHQLPPVPVGGHTLAAAVWTGARVVLFTAGFAQDTNTADVHAYDPATDSWSTLPSIHIAQTQLLDIDPLVAGDQLYVFMPVQTLGNGLSTGNDSFVYRPATNSWADSPMLPAPDGYAIGKTEWTGDHILFGPAGVACNLCAGQGGESTGSWADPRTGEVRHIPPWLPFPSIATNFSWTGSAVLATGSDAHAGAWDPTSNTWTDLPRPPYEIQRAIQIWTGTELLIWGGQLYQRQSSDVNAGSPPKVSEPTGLEFHA